MSADLILDRLKKVKGAGPRQWKACCPAHDDRTPSLSIKETDDGTVLLKCWVGCSAYEIVSSVGLELHDLFPDTIEGVHTVRGNRRAFNARDAIQSVARDGLRVAACASMLSRGEALSAEDMAFLCEAVGRCTGIAEEVL
jgi:hypothetical protein